MLSIKRTGSIAAVIAAVRDVPTGVIPYAASTALTRVAIDGQKAVLDKLPSVYDRPTSYTLNSTRVVPSTVQTLSARVAIKDQSTTGGTIAENYLLPTMLGGERKEKRFERALRFAGLLPSGGRAVIGADSSPDAFGNLKRSELAKALSASKAGKQVKKDGSYFVLGGAKTGRPVGIYRRQGKQLKSVLIFVRNIKPYRPRFDFAGTVEAVAKKEFSTEFYAAAEALVRRRKG